MIEVAPAQVLLIEPLYDTDRLLEIGDRAREAFGHLTDGESRADLLGQYRYKIAPNILEDDPFTLVLPQSDVEYLQFLSRLLRDNTEFVAPKSPETEYPFMPLAEYPEVLVNDRVNPQLGWHTDSFLGLRAMTNIGREVVTAHYAIGWSCVDITGFPDTNRTPAMVDTIEIAPGQTYLLSNLVGDELDYRPHAGGKEVGRIMLQQDLKLASVSDQLMVTLVNNGGLSAYINDDTIRKLAL